MRYTVLLLLSCFSIAPLVRAETESSQSSNPPIYVIDMQRAIDESIVGKAAKSNLKAAVQKGEAKVGRVRSELEQMKADVMKQSSLLSEQALQDKKDALDKKERELARVVQDGREELQRQNSSEIEVIVKEIDAIVKDLAKQKSYGLILEKDANYVLYVKDEFDLTEQVVEMLNKRKTDL